MSETVNVRVGRVEVGVQIELVYSDDTSESITMAKEYDSLPAAREGLAQLFDKWALLDNTEVGVGVCADGADCVCERTDADYDDPPLR